METIFPKLLKILKIIVFVIIGDSKPETTITEEYSLRESIIYFK